MRRRNLVLLPLVTLAMACFEDVTGPDSVAPPAIVPAFAAVSGRDVAISRIVPLQPLPGMEGAYVGLTDMNESGQVAGVSGDRGVVWDESGVPTELPLLPGGLSATPRAINDAGQIVGQVDFGGYTRAALWEDGEVIDLGTLAGYASSVANDISESGDIVGNASNGGAQTLGFFYRDGSMTRLEPKPGDEASTASFVNSSGVVVGVSQTSSSSGFPDIDQLVVWENGELAFESFFSTFNEGWVGLDEDGNGYVTELDPALRVWIVRDGQVSVFFSEEYGDPSVSVTDVSPDGLLVGGIGTWRADPPDSEFGIWIDGVFHEIAYPGNPRCLEVNDVAKVLCIPRDQDTPIVAWLDADQATMEDGVESVTDLSAITRTSTTITLRWTQVDDGTGESAWYRVKYAEAPLTDWSTATVGCDRQMVGDQVGETMDCTVEGLTPETEYDFQLMSFRSEDGVWVDAAFSNYVRRATERDVGELTDMVDDLEFVEISQSGATFRWTQVDDGTGEPARYRLKLAEAPILYSAAQPVCTVQGDQIGAEATCVYDEPLLPGTSYEAQLVSYRSENGVWMGNAKSNVAVASTDTAAVGIVNDLRIVEETYGDLVLGGVSLNWTEVDNGVGEPASYRLRYEAPVGEWEDWKDGELGCERLGTGGNGIGSTIGCRVSGLLKGIYYEFQLMSYRAEDGVWVDAAFSNKISQYFEPDGPPRVEDLRIVDETDASLTVVWTEINDGSIEGENHPASYRVKYSPIWIDWSTATIGCDPTIEGDNVGAPLSCTITGLEPNTDYAVQLMSFWVEDGVWQGAQYSNVENGFTDPASN